MTQFDPTRFVGQQFESIMFAGETRRQTIVEQNHVPVVDGLVVPTLWAVTVSGQNMLLEVRWGTAAGQRLNDVVLPFFAALPGRVQITARLRDTGAPGSASPTLLATQGPVASVARTVATAAGPLGPYASRVTALAAATVTVLGTPVVVATGDELAVVADSELTAGGPILVEHSL